MGYSIESRERTYVKGCGSLSFAKNIGRNLSNKYGQKFVEVEVNDESRGTYNVNSQIKFKTTMLKSSLCDYSDACILVKGAIIVNNTAAASAVANNTDEKIIFKNCAPFTICISEINIRK